MKITKSLALAAVLLMLAPCFGTADSGNAGYDRAQDLLSQGKYEDASDAFNALGKYEDAPQLAMYSAAIAAAEKGDYALAVSNLQSLGSFRDAELLCTYYGGCALESLEQYEEAQRFFEENNIELYSDVPDRIASYPRLIHDRDYRKAEKLLAAGKFEEAYYAFAALVKVNFEPAAEQKLGYDIGTKAQSAGDLATAYACYADLESLYGGYSDSGTRLKTDEIRYQGRYALAMRDAGEEKYKEAYALFSGLASDKPDYQDAQDKAYLLSFTAKADGMKKVGENLIAFSYREHWGLVDLNKNTASNPYWDSIDSFVTVKNPDAGSSILLAKVSKDGKYGYVDSHGDEHVECAYDSVSGYNALGLTLVCQDGRYGYLNTEKYTDGNNAVVPVEFDSVSGFDAATGICRTSRIVDDAPLYGLYGKDGNEIVPPEYKAIGLDTVNGKTPGSAPKFVSGRIQVCSNEDSLWRLMDSSGMLMGIQDNAWDEMGEISCERIPVRRNEKWGYINLQNELKIGGYVDADGSNVVGNEDDILSDGMTVETVYQDASAFTNGLAVVKLEDRYGYIDVYGNLKRIGFRFDSAEDFDGQYASVSVEDAGDTDGRGAWLIDSESEKSLFISIADYKAAYGKAKELQEQAEKAPESDPEKYAHYEEALKLFDSLNGYEDSFDREDACTDILYRHAVSLREQGEFKEPIRLFRLLNEYRVPGVRKQRRATYFKWGLSKRSAADWDGARDCFSNAGTYNPSAETDNDILSYIQSGSDYDSGEDGISAEMQILRTSYLEGLSERGGQNWDGARNCFEHAGEYAPVHDPEDPLKQGSGLAAEEQICKTWYLEGLLDKRPACSWDEARSCFRNAGDYDPNAEGYVEFASKDPLGRPFERYLSAQTQVKETTYQEANYLHDTKKDLVEAHRRYVTLIGYTGGYDGQFVDSIIINDTEMAAAVRKAWLSIGNTVKFGVYEQDGNESNGLEAIEWKVLDTKDGDAMVIARCCLEPMAFYGSRKPKTWADSLPRVWLEKKFLPSAFTDDEIKAVRLTEVQNGKRQASPGYSGTKGSPNTFDRFFLLSYAEVMKYMPEEEDRMAEVTVYAAQRGAYAGADGCGWWWLRTSGSRKDTADGVTAEGVIDRNYLNADRDSVRPACWIDVESVVYPASMTWPERKQVPADGPAVMHHSGEEGSEGGNQELERKGNYSPDDE